VSKAISKLGGNSLAIFTSGGANGQQIEDLLVKEGIDVSGIKVESSTRESFIAVDENTNSQYRFGFPGGLINTSEMETILERVREFKPKFLVASGSLNEGLSTDFYQKIAEIAKQNNAKFIVDTSGDALKKVLEVGAYLSSFTTLLMLVDLL
jgi:6-phosphofructokinase 2